MALYIYTCTRTTRRLAKLMQMYIGINQMRWALEFLKCFKVEYTYPDSIAKIVKDTEVKIIALYAKLGSKLQEIQTQREMDEEDEIKMDDLQSKCLWCCPLYVRARRETRTGYRLENVSSQCKNCTELLNARRKTM